MGMLLILLYKYPGLLPIDRSTGKLIPNFEAGRKLNPPKDFLIEYLYSQSEQYCGLPA